MEAKLGGTALSQCRSVDYREWQLPPGSKPLLGEKGQPAPQSRREARIAALFTPATDGACQSAARIWRLPGVFIRDNRW